MECDRKGIIEPIGIYDYTKNATAKKDMQDIHSKIDELVEAVYYLMSAKPKVYDEKTDMYSAEEPDYKDHLGRVKEQTSVKPKYEPDYKKIVNGIKAVIPGFYHSSESRLILAKIRGVLEGEE